MSDLSPCLPTSNPAAPDEAAATSLAHAFEPTNDPLWLMIDDAFTATREREFESLFSVSNGYLGSRGSIPLGIPLSASNLFLAGVFDTSPPSSIPELVAVPGWTILSQSIGADRLTIAGVSVKEHRRLLDMRAGIFRREFHFLDSQGRSTGVRFLRIASLADRHVLLQSSLCTPENYAGPVTIQSGFLQPVNAKDNEFPFTCSSRNTAFGPVHVLERQTHAGVKVAVAVAVIINPESSDLPELKIIRTAGRMVDVSELEVDTGKTYRIDWLEVCYTSRETEHPADAVITHLTQIVQKGVEPILHHHLLAWNSRWRAADVQIEGDIEAQRAIRFACYHLISAVNPDDERSSIGAKALTGAAYKGHVFWDTEIFLLPFYTLTDPPSARALLMYRFHTLAAARNKARALGYQGALYAWESADTGEEVTPAYAITPIGGVTPVLTGVQAHHISADIAYAVWQYWQATGDDVFLCDAGSEILMETARFWASRGAIESDGFYHIRKVVGPDEYHLTVDDNTYTNWMAQWNLECAARVARMLKERWPEYWRRLVQRIQLDEGEPERWVDLSRVVYAGVHAGSGLIEQFEGYFQLEEINLEQFTPRSLPIDVILGRERTQGAKIIKQADVVMLLHLLWSRMPASMRQANFRYYEPLTEHGSSLSPAIHALIAARLGDTELALRYFQQTREIDLADNMGNASGGVHIAALGGLWQAIVFGFAGLNMSEEGLEFIPHCPASWRCIRFPLLWHGQSIVVHITSTLLEIVLFTGSMVPIFVGENKVIRLEAGWLSRWELKEEVWKEVARERC